MKYVLAADIGGTYTRIGIFTPRGVRKVYHRFENHHYPSATALLHEFRVRHNIPFSKASIAIAGPVRDNKVTTPNLDWHLDESLIKHALLVKDVSLHNDAFAAAAVLDIKTPRVKIKNGRAEKNGTRLVLAPGTGMGAAFSVWNGKRFHPVASEAGHTDFAPSTTLQGGFWEHVHKRFAHVSVERALSGPGLLVLYEYLRELKIVPESAAAHRAIANADMPAKAIIDAGLAGSNALAKRAIEEFTRMLGSFAGSMALATDATGGVYFYGTIANRLLPLLKESSFEHAFIRKGRMKQYCKRIPVTVIKDPDIALTGAYVLSKN